MPIKLEASKIKFDPGYEPELVYYVYHGNELIGKLRDNQVYVNWESEAIGTYNVKKTKNGLPWLNIHSTIKSKANAERYVCLVNKPTIKGEYIRIPGRIYNDNVMLLSIYDVRVYISPDPDEKPVITVSINYNYKDPNKCFWYEGKVIFDREHMRFLTSRKLVFINEREMAEKVIKLIEKFEP